MDHVRWSKGGWLLWGLWLGVLVPLSVEEVWNIPVGHYDIRVQYLFSAAAALLGLVLIIAGKRMPASLSGLAGMDMRGLSRQYLKARFVVPLLIFGLVGLAGFANSENLKRSVFYWIWTFGTLSFVPLLMAVFVRGLGPWVPRTAAFSLILQTVVILIDTLICVGSPEGPYLGRVWQGQPGACRPHAFYHEPNFYAAYALIAMVWMRQWWTLDPDRRWRQFFVAAWMITGVGVFLSTSRMGWGVLAGAVVIEGIVTIRALKRSDPKRLKWLLAGAATAFVLAVSLASQSAEMQRMLASVQGIVEGSDGSLKHRKLFFALADSLFRAHPLVGVGPGAGGAYLAAHMPDHPSLPPRSQWTAGSEEYLRNNPITHSVYTELMAEWGLLGGLAFAAFVILMFSETRGVVLAHAAWAVPLVFSTQQTLPRYDVWAAIGLVWAGAWLARTRRGAAQ